MNEQETVDDIIAEARDKYTVHECNQCAWRKCCSEGFGSEKCGKFRESIWLKLGIEDGYFTQLLDRIDAAHRREVDALKRRRSELNAEVAAKDAVIMRLNDAIAEEQKRHLATTENPSAVGDAAKLREAVCEILSYIESFHKYITPGKGKKLTALFAVADTIRGKTKAALAAPPRNCDKYANHNDAMKAFDAFVREQGKLGFINPYTEAFKWLFAQVAEKEGGKDGK